MNFTWRIDDEVSLRLIEPRHAEEMFALIDRNRERLRPWFRWPPSVETVEQVREKIVSFLEGFACRGQVWTVIEVEGRAVGLAYIHDHDAINKRMELGYWLDAEAEGNGYVTRACRALIARGFEVLGVNRVDITVDVDNAASRAVAERLGFTHEADMASWLCFPDGRCRDMSNYRLLRDDWLVQGEKGAS